MLSRARELWYSLAAVVVVTALYLAAYYRIGVFPRSSGWIGHGIGVIGFVLMLAAETLYSLRKQIDDARWGSLAAWLRFHIFAGLVGPYMVLLHTAMRFNGLAGVSMLLTVVVVASGVVGRYLYTRVPKDADAAAAPARRKALANWHAVHVPLTLVLFLLAFVHLVAAMTYATLQR